MKEIFKCHVSWFKLPPARTREPMVTKIPGMCIDADCTLPVRTLGKDELLFRGMCN